jgi:hypothetical protein
MPDNPADNASEQRHSITRALRDRVWAGADATDRLRSVIEAHQVESGRQTEVMVRLTRWMMWLTIATVGLAVVQVVLAIAPLFKG